MKKHLLLFTLLMLNACGPSVKISPEFEAQRPNMLALLPIEAPETMRAQRINFIRSSLLSELKDQGFMIIDDKIISSFCSSSKCENKSEITAKYPVDAFIKLTIAKSSNSNFGLGSYSAVEGELEITDVSDRSLFKVKHTESKRGGLIFQSGQVFQGLKEQFQNFGDDEFNTLAAKFAKTLVSKIPKEEQSNTNIEVAQIKRITNKRIAKNVHRICIKGTPNSLASLIYSRKKANLREVRSGEYCGIFYLDNKLKANNQFQLELRSAFGNPSTKMIDLENA